MTEIKPQQHDSIFRDMESIVTQVENNLPIPNSELWYRMEMENTAKIYLILFIIGLLMFLSVLLSAIDL